MGININLINSINSFLLKNFKTNLTFLNLVSKKNMKNRLLKRKTLNRYDKFKMSFYTKVQNGYLKLYAKNKNKYKIIDSNKSILTNKKIIISEFKKLTK